MKHDEEWPEYLVEREPETDVERIDEALKADGIGVKSKLEGDLTADLKPGERLRLHWQEVEIEMGEGGIVTFLVEGEPVWRGPVADVEHIHTYSSAIEHTLCGVAINGKVVWIRPVS